VSSLIICKIRVSQLQKIMTERMDSTPCPRGFDHAVFTGPPGTGWWLVRCVLCSAFVMLGKTTLAKIYADLLHSLGIIPSNKFVRVSALTLLGEFEGQTAPKVIELVHITRRVSFLFSCHVAAG
jgi:hypothetical protein